MMKKREYQTKIFSVEEIEDGSFDKWINEQSDNGWKLTSFTQYSSKKLNSEAFLCVIRKTFKVPKD